VAVSAYQLVGARRRRAQLEHAVRVVVGRVRRGVGAVAGGHPDVALGVDDRCRPAHPHRALVVAGQAGHHEGRRGRTVLGGRDDQAVVGATVTGVAAEADDHPARREGQGGALQFEGRVGDDRCGWVDHLVEEDGPGVEVEAEEVVGGAGGPLLGRHHEDLAAGGVDDRGGGDAHGREDVAAESAHRGRGEGRCHVVRPQRGAGVGRQGVDGVVLGGGVDPAGGHQRLSVQAAVEGRGRPRCRGRRERGPRGVDSGT
jgi:hypothetical protein